MSSSRDLAKQLLDKTFKMPMQSEEPISFKEMVQAAIDHLNAYDDEEGLHLDEIERDFGYEEAFVDAKDLEEYVRRISLGQPVDRDRFARMCEKLLPGCIGNAENLEDQFKPTAHNVIRHAVISDILTGKITSVPTKSQIDSHRIDPNRREEIAALMCPSALSNKHEAKNLKIIYDDVLKILKALDIEREKKK